MKKLILIRSGSTAWAEAAQAEMLRTIAGKCQQGTSSTTAVGKDTANTVQDNEVATCADQERRLQGTLPLPLSEQGKEALNQVAEILRQFDIQTIYSSGNESSGPTAEFLAAKCGYKTKKNCDLKEMNCGLWQGLRFRDIEKRYNNAYKQWRTSPESICPPDGENLNDCIDRIENSLLTILKKNKCETTVLVVAEIAAAIIECLVTGKEPKTFWEIADKGYPIRIIELDNIEKNVLPSGKVVEIS